MRNTEIGSILAQRPSRRYNGAMACQSKAPPVPELAPAAVAVFETLQRAGLSEQARLLEIARVWRAAVGERVARHARPERLNRGQLTVRVAHPAWQSELAFLKQQMCRNLNAALETSWVKDIRVLAGSLPRQAAPNPKAAASPTSAQRQAAEATAGAISDPDVRAAFAAMMAKSLAAKPGP